MPTSTNKAE
jgi:hypothetical protein